MAFHEIQFPTWISRGSRGGPGTNTGIVLLDSGLEELTARWASPRRRYQLRIRTQSRDQLAKVRTFYICRDGPAAGFRLEDPDDFTTAANGRDDPAFDDVEIGTGDGSTKQFQLIKKYTDGVVTKIRNITKPVGPPAKDFDGNTLTTTVKVGLGGVEQGSGYSVDHSTGIVTFTTAPTLGTSVTAGCKFDTPVRFGALLDQGFSPDTIGHEHGQYIAIPMIEQLSGLTVAEDFLYGGGDYETITASKQLAMAEGRVQTFKTTTASLELYAPATTSLDCGAPHLYVGNDSTSTQSLTLKTAPGGSTLATLTPGDVVELILGKDSGGSKLWIAIA